MFRPLQVLASCSLLVLGFGACASDDPEGYQSGVDPSLDLGNLTPDQKVTICKSQAAYVHAHVDTTALTRFLCAFDPAVFGARDDATCQAAMDRCVSTFAVKVDVKVTGPDAGPPECVLAPLSTCTGKVSAYEDCVESLADVQIRVGTDFSCGKRHDYMEGPTVGVSACQQLGPTCTSATKPPVIK